MSAAPCVFRGAPPSWTRTDHPDVVAVVDSVCFPSEHSVVIEGWAFHGHAGAAPAVRAVICCTEAAETTRHLVTLPRHVKTSIGEFFGNPALGAAAFRLTTTLQAINAPIAFVALEMRSPYDADAWLPFKRIAAPGAAADVLVCAPPHLPTLIVADGFYADPDGVRAFALQQTFKAHPDAHKGARTETAYRPAHLRQRFEALLGGGGGRRITNWDAYPVNGCFQVCTAQDALVYHCDKQQYAGVAFLTPDAPVTAGTCLLRSRANGLMRVADAPDGDAARASRDMFAGGFYDETRFERVDTVGNRYNRLVLWDAACIHAAAQYFGNDKESGRLFHLFFFDVADE